MKKQILALGAALGAMVLLGAGCAADFGNVDNSNNSNNDKTANSSEQSSPETKNVETTNEAGEFRMTIEAGSANTVTVNWTKPRNVSPASVYRVLDGSRPNPTVAARWDQFTGNTFSATITDAIAGHRYFRVCEYKNGECVQYSNEEEIDVAAPGTPEAK